MERTTDQLEAHRGVINQVFALERKARRMEGGESLLRHVRRIREHYAELGLRYEDLTGEPFDETRTDCEAHIASASDENLVITEVLKPLIRVRSGPMTRLVQRAIVVVESQSELAQ